MTSEWIEDLACAADRALDIIAGARLRGGMTVQESVSMTKLERALEAFLDEVGA